MPGQFCLNQVAVRRVTTNVLEPSWLDGTRYVQHEYRRRGAICEGLFDLDASRHIAWIDSKRAEALIQVVLTEVFNFEITVPRLAFEPNHFVGIGLKGGNRLLQPLHRLVIALNADGTQQNSRPSMIVAFHPHRLVRLVLCIR